MNAISLGPFVFSNDRFIAIVTVLVFLAAAEIIAWHRPDHRDAIRHWTGTAFVVWVIAARLGFVITHWGAFAASPWTVFAIWQGGFDIRAGIFGLVATVAAVFLRHPRAGVPVILSIAAGTIAFGLTTLALPDETHGQIPTEAFADLSGAPVNLATQDGRPLVLNLWATWCPPCRREMPMMVDVAQSLDGAQDGVRIVFANQGEQARSINEFLDLTDLPPGGMIRDPSSALMQEFDLLGLPSTLFFAGDGSLQSVHTGEISRAALLAGIDALKATP
ncbi:TlpA disulfide reductase family protein [uncultured Aliiroseovarius sp.]|uniref:TlpA disulfide reductase family protein n=1 Tax=uncultured Aliiroseovarius sp. TaxID=1658783 RepID=UPI002592061A|nr:TlpA disulfide reductase family protein [uncultured Aliiroseovarius sp.]